MSNGTNRRRSQRLFLQIPLLVEGRIGNNPKFSEETHTTVVNAHGALVDLSVAPEKGKVLKLKNRKTDEQQDSMVVLVSAGDDGRFSVALEFTSPNPNFWRVSFPPDDWTMRHPDAKRSH